MVGPKQGFRLGPNITTWKILPKNFAIHIIYFQGALSIRQEEKVYVTPSGLQKVFSSTFIRFNSINPLVPRV